jgi:hypothetical protein
VCGAPSADAQSANQLDIQRFIESARPEVIITQTPVHPNERVNANIVDAVARLIHYLPVAGRLIAD